VQASPQKDVNNWHLYRILCLSS